MKKLVEVKDGHVVFVYGTLKKGFSNHEVFLGGRSVPLGEDSIFADLYNLGPYPAIKEGTTLVTGECYIVGDNTLKNLDKLEGHPVFYRRKLVDTICKRKAWAYFFLPEVKEDQLIKSGVWEARAS